jgi:hypothetical protein
MKLTEPIIDIRRTIDLSDASSDKAEAIRRVVAVLMHQNPTFCEDFAGEIERMFPASSPRLHLVNYNPVYIEGGAT